MAEEPWKIPRGEVEPGLRRTMELIAKRCDVGVGRSRVELDFQDGELLHVWTHQKVPGTAVDDRFQPVE